MVKVRPLDDRVLIRPLKREEVTRSGIVLPDTAKEKPQEGEVLAVGPGRLTEEGKRVPSELKVGERVLYDRYGPTEVKIEGEELLLAKAEDILGVIESK